MTSASGPLRPRRDRHGRGQRGPMAWPPVPAMATRAERFDQLVLDAAGRMEHHAGPAMGDLEFAVEDVPPSDPAPWESSDVPDRKSTRLNSSHLGISYAVFCLKKKKK